MGYFFISFVDSENELGISNAVIDEHPMGWQRDMETLYPGQYVLISWIEITREEYLMVNGGA